MPTARLPLIGVPTARNASSVQKDQRFVNCFPESLKNPETETSRFVLQKRPGLKVFSTITTATNVTPRGIFYWAVNNKQYSVFDNKLYSDTTEILTLAGSTGRVGFTEAQGAENYLVVVDGTNGYRIDKNNAIYELKPSTWTASTAKSVGALVNPTVSNGKSYRMTSGSGSTGGAQPTWPTTVGATVVDNGITWTCVDLVSFPSPHIPQPIFFDGYVFLMADTPAREVFNSAVQDILTWKSDNFISAEMYPDKSVGIARQSNQLVVFGRKSVEFFYDAQNATGSPLRRAEQFSISMGTASWNSIASSDGLIMFVGQTEAGGRFVAGIEDMKLRPVSTEAIDRILAAETGDIETMTGYLCRIAGHLLYVINLQTQNRTLVYDLTEKIWHEWSSSATYIGKFLGQYQCENQGKCLLQYGTKAVVYEFDINTYQDDASPIYMMAQTAKFDADNDNRKFFGSLSVVGDRTSSSSVISISWSDDDYLTWNTPRQVNMQNSRMNITRLGSSRRRAFRLEHSSNENCRIELLEIEFESGTA